jgi:ABC1 atypical kinase-like domain
LLREFSDALLAELDYGHEAANVKFCRDFFANEHGFKIPEVIDKYSKNRVLTEERVKGRKASDVADVPKRGRASVLGHRHPLGTELRPSSDNYLTIKLQVLPNSNPIAESNHEGKVYRRA